MLTSLRTPESKEKVDSIGSLIYPILTTALSPTVDLYALGDYRPSGLLNRNNPDMVTHATYSPPFLPTSEPTANGRTVGSSQRTN